MTGYKRISTELKEDVIDYCVKHPDVPKSEVARGFGVSVQALYKWLKLATGEAGKISVDAMNDKALIKQLQKENQELRDKNEILARASLYISEHIAPKDVTLRFKN